MADEVLLSPLVDFLFKRLFGDEERTDLLIAFLNGIFEDAGAPRVTSVQLLNPYIDKDALTDKMSVLDILARTEQATLIAVEIQIRNTGEMRERSLYYWTKLYEGQLHESETYHSLHPAAVITVLDFVEIPNDRVHNVFQIKNQDGALLTNHLTLHFLELPKLAQPAPRESTPLVRWLTFLKAQTKADREVLVKGDPIMEKALNTLEFLSHDEQTRQRYEARQKALHDYATAIETAKREGREEGRQEGRQEGEHQKAREFARYLLTHGTAMEEVAQATGLSVTEVAAIAKTLQ